MADRTRRVPENLPGSYYVDRECIDCDLCRELAPDNFQRNEDEGYSYVYKQPESDDERVRCEEARDSCPVEAIGADGAVGSEQAAESPRVLIAIGEVGAAVPLPSPGTPGTTGLPGRLAGARGA